MSHPHGLVLPDPDELRRLPPDGGERWNRLVFEKSPYLLQHAGNPVDWYPWGDEAFRTAARLDRPVFLSVGYSTCHWCHVMERESFEDEEVAGLLNEAFVCVKVDREERPDVDHVYMTVTQALTGSGGWPMTVVLTPDKRPFFAGTYFPKHGRHGRAGMMELVPRLSEAWTKHREHVVDEAARITEALASLQAPVAGAALPDGGALDLAQRQLESRFDPVHGGFGRAPKFPTAHQLSLLLRRHARTGDEHALAMVEKTLVEMRAGGVFDQVGWGIHRYSTDERWLVPHFEKMLYDQALAAIAAAECHAVTGEERHATMAREILEYVRRDMTSPDGAFYSAEDADSEGEEGLFYVWTARELREALGDDAPLAIAAWNVSDEGNFLEEATRRRTGANILHVTRELDEIAADLGLDVDTLRVRLESARRRLFEIRKRRVHPLKDDKVLTDWNGLMIAAFAIASRHLRDESYARDARRAADDVLRRLVRPDGRCLKRMRGGEAGLAGMLEDHAFLAWGLLELHQATLDDDLLEAALRVTRAMIGHFADEANGGFFLSPDDGEPLPVRGKDAYDGALPSGNSVAALVLVKLSLLLGDATFRDRADGVFRAFADGIERAPSAHAFLLSALQLALGPSVEVVVAGDLDRPEARALLDVARSGFRPEVLVLARTPRVAELAPFTAGMEPIDGRPAAHACTATECRAPVTTPAELAAQLDAISRSAKGVHRIE